MPEPATHAELMHQKVQEKTKSISEVVQDLLETMRASGEIPSTQ